jgi:hypothetical protein
MFLSLIAEEIIRARLETGVPAEGRSGGKSLLIFLKFLVTCQPRDLSRVAPPKRDCIQARRSLAYLVKKTGDATAIRKTRR